jgi:transcriptional regulator with XRE-family HTH domain
VFKEAREKQGLTQEQIGKKLGVDTQFISNMERKTVSIPAKHFLKLSETLKIPVKRFVEYNVERYRARMKREIEKTK